MKKSIIATAGVAAFAVAAIPAAVFAATTQVTSNSFTDNLSLTINGGCTFRSEVSGAASNVYTRNYVATIAAGQEADFETSDANPVTISVVCNTTSGKWLVSAIGGTSTTGTADTTLSGTSLPAINTGTTFSGDTSAWAFKITSTGALADSTATPPYNYGEWSAVPSTLTPVAKGDAQDAKSAAGVTFAPAYHVYASGSQTAGTYTGAVSYAVTNPLN